MRTFISVLSNGSLRCRLIPALLLAFVSGCACGGQPVSDPTQAEEILSKALEAWKAGTSSDSLSAQSPSIVVFDPDWQAGAGLVSFEPQAARLAGHNVTLPVKLTLKTGKGRKIQRMAVYAITTNPVNMIVREEG